MAYTLRKQFSTALANTFLNDIQYQRNNYYYFLGKLEPWGSEDRPPAIVQELSEHEDVAIRNNAAYFKKITPNDVTLVCARNEWTTGIVYAQWDDTQDMEGQQFFVVTDESQVYKCLDNRNGAVSTVKPTGRPLMPFKTVDGYTWKYMYSIPSFKKTRFTSTNYIPVQRALSESFYNQGSVDSVSIINSGSGYTDSQQTFIVASGSTTGSGAVATFTLTPAGGIASVTVTNGGSGYTKGVRVSVASTIGQDAVLSATVVGGVVTAITVVNPGVGYDLVSSIQFTVGGGNLIPVVSRSTGEIVDVLIIDGGAGYVSAPTLTINTTTPSEIGGAYEGNSSAILEAVVDRGTIKQVLIRDPGINYPSDTATTIQIQGDGYGLDLSPVIYNGEIIDVVVESPGYGYTNLLLTVFGTGTGAMLRPIFAASDVTSDQSVIEQIAVEGAIYSVKITNGGTGYNSSTTTVSISGDGTGATAHCVVVGNVIQGVVMDSWGSGYSTVTVTFSDPNRINDFGQYVDAQAYAILPPGNGHGTDAVKELYGRTVAISSSIRSDPLLTQYQQDYRQFGIISQSRNMISNKTSTADFDFNVYKVVFANTIDLEIDEVLVFQGLYRYRVVFIESVYVYLQPLHKDITNPIGTLVSETVVDKTYNSTEIVARPIINKHTGNLIYIANEQPFEFSDTQGLLIKTYISF